MITRCEIFIKRVNLGIQPTSASYKRLMFKCMLDEEGIIVVPEKYKSLYNTISEKIKEVGEDIIMDCEATSRCKNTPIINCWVMFQSLIAAYNLKMEKQEKMFHKFIVEQLKLI